MSRNDSDLAAMVLENQKADKIFALALKLPRGEISNKAFLSEVEAILNKQGLVEELQAWREVGKLLTEADPMHPETSPALARMHVLGIREANSRLRSDCDRLKDQLMAKAMAFELTNLALKQAQKRET